MTPRTRRLADAGEALAEALERVHERDRLRARCDEALAALRVRMRAVAEARKESRRATAAAERLARPGIRRLAASLAGDGARRAEDARRQAGDAKLQFDAAKASADADQKEIREIRARIESMGDVDAACFAAFAAKEEAIADASPRAREVLRRVAAAVAETKARLAAVNEVSESAGRARLLVRRLRDELRAARRGGGLGQSSGSAMAAGFVQQQMDLRSAMESARQVETRLARLTRESAAVPELGARRAPTFERQGFLIDGGRMGGDNERIDAWLDRLFARIKARRRTLDASIAKIEARRDRWILRAGGAPRASALRATGDVS